MNQLPQLLRIGHCLGALFRRRGSKAPEEGIGCLKPSERPTGGEELSRNVKFSG
jgi:hypothetical protein